MTMKILVLKDSGDYKAGFEGFIPRPLGKKMCQEKTAVPWSMRDKVSPAEAKAIKKVKAEKEKAKGAALIKKSYKPKAETTYSKKSKYKY